MILRDFFLVESLNFLILQWFCLRLTIESDRNPCMDTIEFKGKVFLTRNDYKYFYRYWSIQGFILPFTGWTDEYTFIRKKQEPHFSMRVSKKVEYEYKKA